MSGLWLAAALFLTDVNALFLLSSHFLGPSLSSLLTSHTPHLAGGGCGFVLRCGPADVPVRRAGQCLTLRLSVKVKGPIVSGDRALAVATAHSLLFDSITLIRQPAPWQPEGLNSSVKSLNTQTHARSPSTTQRERERDRDREQSEACWPVTTDARVSCPAERTAGPTGTDEISLKGFAPGRL
ncbi:hypothetical protein Q8A67_021651 [Cirrhinus molitorella]|uniref:Secreted protein n=1 Tax=Cirrhinus molitorella TaxID=172907 RepID=A0AA88TMZ2_9TELE|nr:hypothetical protein Q8A67_021651 [Cirrhinus molitorella]